MKFQGRSKRKFTGGRRVANRGKRKFELGREAGEPHIAPIRKKVVRTLGGNSKVRLLRCDVVCVSDSKTGKSKMAKIENVTGNEANLHYIRRNILTKGSIIKTDMGSARVTNKPGQDGTINAILISE